MNDEDRAAWLAERKGYIGASEAGAILGIDPHSSPLDVWARKVMDLPSVTSDAMESGNDFEPVILARYARRMGRTLTKPGMLRHAAHPIIGANLDSVADGRINVQAKMVGFHAARKWGPDDSGPEGVPEHYLVQVQQEMEVADLDETEIAAQIGTELRVYRVPRDRVLALAVIEVELDFWNSYVVPKEPPDGAWSSELLAARFPKPTRGLLPAPPVECRVCGLAFTCDGCDLTPDVAALALNYGAARDLESAAKKEKEGIGVRLMEAIADADGYMGAWGKARWRLQRGRVDWQAYALALGGTEQAAENHRAATGRVIDVRLKAQE